MASLLASRVRRPHILHHLRKSRKNPFTPYKAKWHEDLNRQEAMETLKRASAMLDLSAGSSLDTHEDASVSSGNVNSEKPVLLSIMLNSFRSHQCHPTPDAYHFVAKTLLRNSQFVELSHLLDHIEAEVEIKLPETFFIDLIKMLGRIGRIEDAVELFFRIPKFRFVPSTSSLNALLTSLCGNPNSLTMVPKVLLMGHRMRIRIEDSTLRILVMTLCRFKRVCYAIKLANRAWREGDGVDPVLCSSILEFLSKGNYLSAPEASNFLKGIQKLGFSPGRDDYYHMIALLGNVGKGMDAWQLLNGMKKDGFFPDLIFYKRVLNAVIDEGLCSLAEEVFDEILIIGLIPDACTYNGYLRGLCKQRKVEEGMELLVSMEELCCKPNSLTYNLLLDAICSGGDLITASELLKEMKMKGVPRDPETYRIMIDSVLCVREITRASVFLKEMMDDHLLPPPSMVDDIVCGLCDKFLVFEAIQLLETLCSRNFSPGYRTWMFMLPVFVSESASVPKLLGCLLNSSKGDNR